MSIDNLIKQIAMQNGVSVSEVKKDLQEALDSGWNNPDPKVQAFWRGIPTKHKKPTLEEVIAYITVKSNTNYS